MSIEEKKFINQLEQDNYLDYSFDRKVDEWLQKPHDLHEIEQGGVHDYFVNLKKEYLKAHENFKGTDKEKLLGRFKRHIGEVRARFDDSIELRDHISLINNSPEQQGTNWMNFKKSKTGQEIAEAMSGGKQLSWENNFAGYEIDGEFMSTYDIRKLIDKKTLDVPSRNLINSVIEYSRVLGSYEDAGELNMKDIEFKIKNEVVKKGNKESLKNDNLIQTEGGSFKVDMVNRLQEMTYQDLGITNDMLSNIDDKLKSVNISDGISEDEAILIYDELEKNEELTDEYLTKYFAQHVKSHYDHFRPKQASTPGMIRNEEQNTFARTNPLNQEIQKYKKGSI